MPLILRANDNGAALSTDSLVAAPGKLHDFPFSDIIMPIQRPPTQSLSLPRSVRLRSGYQHAKVRAEGLSLHGRFIRISVLALRHQGSNATTIPEFSQGAAVASRRVGGAVVRNQVKRRLREIFRHERPRLKPGIWLIVTAKPTAATASFSTLRAEWLRLAERLSIFADS
jgi:ribonuclease P protein component